MRASIMLALTCMAAPFAIAHGQSAKSSTPFRYADYADYYAQAEVSPSDARDDPDAEAALPPAPVPEEAASSVEAPDPLPPSHDDVPSWIGHSKQDDCECFECRREVQRLFPDDGCGLTVNGWVAVGATAHADQPRSNFNGPVTFNDRTRMQANQVYLSVGRDVETGGCGLDIGGRVDVLFGSDYIFTQAAGLETHDDGTRHWNRSGNQYGLALPQAYVELGLNNWNVKLGHFYTIIGNETVTAPDNFFYSHAYTMQYGEPFTHTGGLASWNAGGPVTLHGGLVNGWDKFDAEVDRGAFLGGVTYESCDGCSSLAFAIISGDEDGADPPIAGNRTMYSIVYTRAVNDDLQFVLQSDKGWQDNPGDDFDWYGVNSYLLYTINPCWKMGLRAEWFRDVDGSRLVQFPIRVGGAGILPQGDFAGNYYELTAGLNWTPNANVTVRPEIRWDWSDSTLASPYDDFTKDSQFTGAFDIIMLF